MCSEILRTGSSGPGSCIGSLVSQLYVPCSDSLLAHQRLVRCSCSMLVRSVTLTGSGLTSHTHSWEPLSSLLSSEKERTRLCFIMCSNLDWTGLATFGAALSSFLYSSSSWLCFLPHLSWEKACSAVCASDWTFDQCQWKKHHGHPESLHPIGHSPTFLPSQLIYLIRPILPATRRARCLVSRREGSSRFGWMVSLLDC